MKIDTCLSICVLSLSTRIVVFDILRKQIEIWSDAVTEEAYVPFPKIPRLNREVIVTEKIDGTNAQVFIAEDGVTILAGSRTRWITPEADNFGFAAWVRDNRDKLLKLGPGRHFGEWWGSAAARGFMKPEGIIVFHTAASAGFKVTLEKDEEPKSVVEWRAKQAAA